MSKEKILIYSDSLTNPSGFGNNTRLISWALAKKYEVHILGLQSNKDVVMELDIENETREVTEHAIKPLSGRQPDLGYAAMPKLLDELEPEILLTLNDIQLVGHIPQMMCPQHVQLKVMDLPAKDFVPRSEINMQLDGVLQKFRERFPRKTKWIMYAPHDGVPPLYNWKFTYQMADKCVAMSKFGQKIFSDYFNMDVPFIWHGVDSAIFKPGTKPDEVKDKFVVGDINRNQVRKQPVRLIQAFAKFAKDKDDVLLHLQKEWNPDYGYNLEHFVKHYKIHNKLIKPFQYGVNRQSVANIMNLWDVNMMPVEGEGFGFPIIESGMCAKPTIMSDYTTARELITEGKPCPRGQLVKGSMYWHQLQLRACQSYHIDIDDTVKALNKYYHSRQMLERHGRNARKWALKNVAMKKLQYDWIKLVEDTLNGE